MKEVYEFHRIILEKKIDSILQDIYNLSVDCIGYCSCAFFKMHRPEIDLTACVCTEETRYDCQCDKNKTAYLKKESVIEIISQIKRYL